MDLGILNLNIWLLPQPFSMDNSTRLMSFMGLVKKLNPDIITLQEVWINRYIYFLKKNLSNYHFTRTKKSLFNISGLLTLTKSKPYFVSHNKYKCTKKLNLLERIAQKGYLTTKVRINGNKITAINTHIYRPVFKSERTTSISQFNELKTITQRDDKVVIGADLNISLEDFKKYNNGFFVYENNHPNHVNQHNKYQRSRLNTWGYNEKHDYVICRSNSTKPIIKSRVISKPILSDHYPLYAKIKI